MKRALALIVTTIAAASVAACERASTSTPVDDAGVAVVDATVSDGTAPVDAGRDAALPPLPDPLTRLSETGLYDDFATKALSPAVIEFAPASVLWSDGAEKHRYIALPPGTKIDTSDMDHWRFPIGTRFFKEFAREGKRLETRLIVHRADTGNVESDYWVGSFVWRDDESDADLAPAGKQDIRGTDHDAPAQTQCFTCHQGDKGRILGFSALQLSKPGAGVTLKALAASGLLTNPPPDGVDYPFPGAGTPVGTALAYMHANCGHCHNEHGSSWPDTQMVLRLNVGETDLATSGPVKSTVGVALQRWQKPGFTLRVSPGKPSESAILFRANARGDRDQMPPIATEHVDANGIAALTAWISSL